METILVVWLIFSACLLLAAPKRVRTDYTKEFQTSFKNDMHALVHMGLEHSAIAEQLKKEDLTTT